jgi:hypothetical protein
MNKLGILGATAALLTVPALGVSYAAAQGGADDPAGHVRHSGADDAPGHEATHQAGHRARADDHGRRHGGHGADDPAGHVRHSGADDPAGHDAGDDHGGRHGGDDHGGRHGSDDD